MTVLTESRGSPISPRLAALRRALDGGDPVALDAFWKEIAAHGTPLIEPLEASADHSLVTFLWRTSEDVDNVVVMSHLAGFDLTKYRLSRLPGTSLWYKSIRARNDLRTTYRFSVNDSLIPFDGSKDWNKRTLSWRHDPLNPRTFIFAKNDERSDDTARTVSVIELPSALPLRWAVRRPDVPAGNVELHRVRSSALGNERRVWVYTPPGYDGAGGEQLGLLLLFDGWAYIHLVPTPTILDNLLAEGRIPPLVAVLPDSLTHETRTRELPCHPPFADFLADELLPWIRRCYNVTADPAQAIVAGSSNGSLAAAFAGLRHPELFGNVLSQSGSFWQSPESDGEPEWLARQFAATERFGLRFYLDVGRLETRRAYADGPSQIEANRHLRNVLRAKGYAVHYAEYNGGHDYLCWQGTLADGLLALRGS